MAILTRNNRFIIDYRPHGRYGKRVRTPLPPAITSIDEAREIEASLKAVRKKQDAPVTPTDASVDELFAEYLAWYRLRRSPQSLEDLNYTYKRHITRILGIERITALNIAHVNLYQTLRRVDGVCNRTINKELDYISGFLRWCRETHSIPCGVLRDRLPCTRPITLSAGTGTCSILGSSAISPSSAPAPFLKKWGCCGAVEKPWFQSRCPYFYSKTLK